MADKSISHHILPVSAALAGVSITVVSIVRFMEVSRPLRTVVDVVMAFDGFVFLLSGLLSYASLRSDDATSRLERIADGVFLFGFCVMVVASLMLALEIG